jgi:hypothetical protein
MTTRYYKQEGQEKICCSKVPCVCGYSTSNHTDNRGWSKACLASQKNPGSDGLCMSMDTWLRIMQISKIFLDGFGRTQAIKTVKISPIFIGIKPYITFKDPRMKRNLMIQRIKGG